MRASLDRLCRRAVMVLRSVFRRGAADDELDDELRFHFERLQESAVARGEAPAAARRQAQRQMGSVTFVKEASRDVRSVRPVEHFLQDLRFGARLLVRGPGFTTVAVLSLACGIGISSAIFSVINAVVLRPLPVAAPEDLFIAEVTVREQPSHRFSYPVVQRVRALLVGRADVAAQTSVESAFVAARMRGDTGPQVPAPEAAWLQLVTGDFFGTLRQQAQVGRLLDPDHERSSGEHPAAVISDRYWSARFNRAPDIVGTELIVNGTSMTVVGVAAQDFFGTSVDARLPDIWASATMQSALRFQADYGRIGGDLERPWPAQPEVFWLNVILRMSPDDTAAGVEAMTLALRRETPPVDGPDAAPARVALLPGAGGFSSMREDLATPLLVLLLMVSLLLIIGCANLASLLLARATHRAREMAIRLSIGAGRGRLIRQLLTESVLLASLGGGLGLGVAYWGSTALLDAATQQTVTGIDVRPDWRVVGLTCATAFVAAMLFGLLPAVRGSRVPLADTLKAGGRSVAGAAGRRGRLPIGKVLIAGQMAFAVLLVLVAALFARSLQAMMRVDVGYDRARLLIARIDPRAAGYALTDLPALHDRILERLAAVPGVTHVSASSSGPFSGSRNRGDFEIDGYTRPSGERLVADYEWVTADYFRTVGLAVTRGRGFLPEDLADGRRVSVINETMARRHFPGQDPLGRRWGRSRDFERFGFEIVGVVEDARYNDVTATGVSMAYVPAAQGTRHLRSVEIRTAGDPASLVNPVRAALRGVEPSLATGAIDTLDSRVVRSIDVERLLGRLTMAFGAAALGLACLGLYGTMSYAVRRRTAELGVRIALGSGRIALQRLVVREALTLVLVGGAVGLPLAFFAARAIGGLLYATPPSDPVAYATAVGVLVVVSACAAYVPAWKASRLDPMIALRPE
jgi:predicted permease